MTTEPWLKDWVPESGRVAIDIGANCGVWSRWLASRFGHVIAIEPNPEALPDLRRDLPGNVTVHTFAAWKEETILTFSRYALSVHLSAYFKGEGILTGPRIGEICLPARPIDSLNIDRVDFVKCDTEGAEIECLLGAKELIRRNKPAMMIEIHSVENFLGVIGLLADWRYLFTIIRHRECEPYSDFWFLHCWISAHKVI